jgi:hypothetical protein
MRRYLMKNQRSNKTVCETVGDMILSSLAVISKFITYLQISSPGPIDTAHVTINGKIGAKRVRSW